MAITKNTAWSITIILFQAYLLDSLIFTIEKILKKFYKLFLFSS